MFKTILYFYGLITAANSIGIFINAPSNQIATAYDLSKQFSEWTFVTGAVYESFIHNGDSTCSGLTEAKLLIQQSEESDIIIIFNASVEIGSRSFFEEWRASSMVTTTPHGHIVTGRRNNLIQFLPETCDSAQSFLESYYIKFQSALNVAPILEYVKCGQKQGHDTLFLLFLCRREGTLGELRHLRAGSTFGATTTKLSTITTSTITSSSLTSSTTTTTLLKITIEKAIPAGTTYLPTFLGQTNYGVGTVLTFNNGQNEEIVTVVAIGSAYFQPYLKDSYPIGSTVTFQFPTTTTTITSSTTSKTTITITSTTSCQIYGHKVLQLDLAEARLASNSVPHNCEHKEIKIHCDHIDHVMEHYQNDAFNYYVCEGSNSQTSVTTTSTVNPASDAKNIFLSENNVSSVESNLGDNAKISAECWLIDTVSSNQCLSPQNSFAKSNNDGKTMSLTVNGNAEIGVHILHAEQKQTLKEMEFSAVYVHQEPVSYIGLAIAIPLLGLILIVTVKNLCFKSSPRVIVK